MFDRHAEYSETCEATMPPIPVAARCSFQQDRASEIPTFPSNPPHNKRTSGRARLGALQQGDGLQKQPSPPPPPLLLLLLLLLGNDGAGGGGCGGGRRRRRCRGGGLEHLVQVAEEPKACHVRRRCLCLCLFLFLWCVSYAYTAHSHLPSLPPTEAHIHTQTDRQTDTHTDLSPPACPMSWRRAAAGPLDWSMEVTASWGLCVIYIHICVCICLGWGRVPVCPHDPHPNHARMRACVRACVRACARTYIRTCSHAARPAPSMSALSTAPVPRGLVRINASPSCNKDRRPWPCLWRRREAGASPVMLCLCVCGVCAYMCCVCVCVFVCVVCVCVGLGVGLW
jgi:hypothetical protein